MPRPRGRAVEFLKMFGYGAANSNAVREETPVAKSDPKPLKRRQFLATAGLGAAAATTVAAPGGAPCAP